MITRRSFLKLGLQSALAAAIAGPLAERRARAAGAPMARGKAAPARACIFLYMVGGPSQMDTFDPKPGTANSGGVGAVSTAVAGMQLSELLPKLAGHARELAVVRSIVSKEGNHPRARSLMHTGYSPGGAVVYPAFGSIVASEHGGGALPPYVAIGPMRPSPGFLGAADAPFPIENPHKSVPNLAPRRPVSAARLDHRVKAWRYLDDEFAAEHPHSTVVRDQREVGERALALMRSPAVKAFDVDKEPAKVRQAYGNSKFGLGCLMARRLVEASVPFVEVSIGGWDTHYDNLKRMRPVCAVFDQAVSSLLSDLRSRGLLDSTLVVCIGEFGRTPWINARAGRDHYPHVTPAVFAGGGVRGGQVIGKTSADGRGVTDDPVSVPQVMSSMAHALGLDPDKTRISPAGRPVTTVDGGADPIPKLFA